MRISINEVNYFLRCRRLWDYSSDKRKNLAPRKPPRQLWLGEGVHAAIEAYYENGTYPPAAFETWARAEIRKIKTRIDLDPEDEAELEEQYHLGYGMVKHYYEYAQEHDTFKVLLCEQEFAVPIPAPDGSMGNGLLVGRFDGVVRDLDGRHWLIEHKTYSGDLHDEWLVLNQQTLAYTWAAQQVSNHGDPDGPLIRAGIPRGAQIMGTLYNGLRKKVPTEPKSLKSGGLSRALNIDTTAERYTTAVLDNSESPRDYEDVIEHLRRKGNTFFKREWVHRAPHELDLFAARLFDIYCDMSNPNVRIYPTPTMDCHWQCSFLHPCIARNQGDDEKFLLDRSYRQREPRGFVYVEPNDA